MSVPLVENEALPELAGIDELCAMPPEAQFQWALRNFGERAGIITSFQDTGCVMIDLMARHAPGMRVITVDTLRLPEETLRLSQDIEEKYGIAIERFTPDAERLRNMVARHGEFLFFDSKAKQEYCCTIRKVEPNQRALATLDVWFTGLRRDQSAFRGDTPRAQWVTREGRPVLKIAPLADWTQDRVDGYVRENGLPKNRLYDQGYTSIGCVVCTTPTLPHEDRRAGRWRWFNLLDGDKKECGIHSGGSGI